MSVIVGKTTLKLTLLHSDNRIGLRIKRQSFIEQPSRDSCLGQLLGVAEERFLHNQKQKAFHPIVKTVHCHGQLFEIVGAACTVRPLTNLLHRGDQKRDEYGDDGDHHQQFH